MFGRGQERAQRWRVAFRLITWDAGRRRVARSEGALEEGTSGRRISVIAQVHVDDLPVLVEAAEHVPPAPRNLEQGLVHTPARPDQRAVPARRGDEAGGERLHPVVDRARVDDDVALGEPLGNLGVAQAVAHIPADGEGDHLVGKAAPGEGAA